MQKVNPRVVFAIAVVGGLIVGKLIKRFPLGLLVGVLISLIYVLIISAPKRKP
jgi:hypothetical protein